MRREGGKRDTQGGRNLDKLRKFCNILLYFTIEIGQRGGNHFGMGQEAGVKVTGSGSFSTPCPSPHSSAEIPHMSLCCIS